MRARSLALWTALTSAIGPDELQFWGGLVLIAAGFWLCWRPGAFLVPGAILIWAVLPARAPFVIRTLIQEKPPRRTP